ncbi:MAG: hypothetical protein AVDCRST_MAG27-1990 [uncultured Craurococcus sp.]|uniref:Uncharacterized protein n=1 Tax=uncultured Craurococcus sp. TaxID=1135998 RepID=A0A6J4IGP5_9PROT|nr:MAG: hypothetical protein AVDCRST_MAG27-1990 [uncultured Craurococcus sp.]
MNPFHVAADAAWIGHSSRNGQHLRPNPGLPRVGSRPAGP